jgi:urate oxidase
MFEWSVGVTVDGDFEASFAEGNNARILPGDTMKNCVYSLARNSYASCIEDFAQELIGFLLDWNGQIDSVRVDIEETPWKRIAANGAPHPTAFQRCGPEVSTTCAHGSRTTGIRIQSGLKGLSLIKTSNAAFEGFIRDSLTTLPEMSDRLLGTEATIKWTYSGREAPFMQLRPKIVETLLAAFADHESQSVHHTLYAMGHQVLDSIPEVVDIKIVLMDRNCVLVDLTPFGQDNPNEVFVPTEEPLGYVEAKVVRQ